MDNNANITRIQLVDGPQTGFLNVKNETSFPITRAIGDIRDLSSRSGTFSKEITLTGDKNNNILLNNYFDVNIKAGTFDINKRQKCAIIQNGVLVLDNCFLRLLKVKKVQSRGEEIDDLVEYTVQVRDSIGDFFKEINNKELIDLKGLSIFNHNYTVANIQSSFTHTWEDGYKYILPWINTSDYNISELLPGIFAKKYWDLIHQQAGYSYEWGALTASTTQFDKLIIPFSGDKKKISEEFKIENEVIAEDSIDQINTNSTLPGFNYNLPIKKVNVNTEIKDNNNFYNPTTSIFQSPWAVYPPNALIYEVQISWEMFFNNKESVNAFLLNETGFGDCTYRPLLSVRNTSFSWKGDTGLNITTTPPLNTGGFFIDDTGQGVKPAGLFDSITPGINVFATGDNTVSIQASNISILEQIILAFNGSVDFTGYKWRRVDTGDALVEWGIKIKEIKIKITPQSDSILPNSEIELGKFVPRKVKQSDFLKSIYQKYNLFAEIDPVNPNKIIYTSRDEFYDSGTQKDWTEKLEKKIDQHLQFVPELSSKKLILSYKDDDNDGVLKSYKEETSETYGQIEVEFDNENVRGIERKEEIFSPTINIDTDFGANLPVLNADFKYNLRILYDGGTIPCGTYSITEYPGSSIVLSAYTFTSMVNRPQNPTFDISYAQPDYYAYNIVEGTENNLYTNHWRRTLAQINSGKLLTAYFWLTEEDIQKLKLNDIIKVNNALWYINAVIDYDANNKRPTKVELLSIEDDLRLPMFGRIVKPTKPGVFNPRPTPGPVKPVGPLKPVVDGISGNIRLRNLYTSSVGYTSADIQGVNNVVPSGFKGSILPNNINAEEDGFYTAQDVKMTSDGYFTGENSLTKEGLQIGEMNFGPSGITNNSSYVDDFYIDDEYFESFSSYIIFSGDSVEISNLTLPNELTVPELNVNGALNIDGKVLFVTKKSDLPNPNINNEIELEPNVTYFISGLIDLSGSTLIGGANTTILGGSSENCILTSTGLSAGTPLLKSIYTTPVRHISINDVDTAIEFDGSTNPDEMALDWTGINFLNVPNIGLIKDASNFIYDKGAFLNSKGLKFDGTIGTVGLNNSLFQGDGLSGSLLEVMSSCTITRRFRTIYSSAVAFSATTGIHVSTGATIPSEAYILDTVNFAGGGTYLSGVDNLSNKSLFINCVRINNTSVNGQMYMRGNAVATTITGTTDFVKVAGVTTASTENEKYIMTDNRLTNDAVISRKYLVQCSLSFNAGNNNVCEFGIFDSKLGAIRQPSIISSTANAAGRAENISMSCIINHSQGDYIEIWTRNTSATSNITVSEMNVVITEFK